MQDVGRCQLAVNDRSLPTMSGPSVHGVLGDGTRIQKDGEDSMLAIRRIEDRRGDWVRADWNSILTPDFAVVLQHHPASLSPLPRGSLAFTVK